MPPTTQSIHAPLSQTWTSEGELSSKGVMAKLAAKYKHPSGMYVHVHVR